MALILRHVFNQIISPVGFSKLLCILRPLKYLVLLNNNKSDFTPDINFHLRQQTSNCLLQFLLNRKSDNYGKLVLEHVGHSSR